RLQGHLNHRLKGDEDQGDVQRLVDAWVVRTQIGRAAASVGGPFAQLAGGCQRRRDRRGRRLPAPYREDRGQPGAHEGAPVHSALVDPTATLATTTRNTRCRS